MAVPKKRTSKYRKRFHKNVWKGKADRATVKAFSLDESISTGRSKIFYYTTNDKPFGSSKSTGINESNDS